MIRVEGVSKRFKKKSVLEVFDFIVKAGSKVGIVGDSGCGKSTLARMITGLADPTEGSIYLDQTKTIDLSRIEKSRIVQMVFQHPQSSFDSKMKVGDQLDELGKIHKSDFTNDIKVLLKTFLLDEKLLDRYPFQISGGEAQRLSIIKCLLLKPKVLILDEPTSMLDVSVQAEIISFLLEVQKKENITLIFVSHDLELVSHVCDEVIVINDHKIIDYGTVESVIDHPTCDYTKALIESFRYFD